MNRQIHIHGIVSMILFIAAFSLGIIAAAVSDIWEGGLCLLLVIVAFFAVAYVYCAKCLCRERCNHVVFGKLSVLLTKRNNNPYRSFDYIAGLTPLFMVMILLQFWLIRNLLLLGGFWVLMLIGGLDAYFFICPACLNMKCRMCRNKLSILKHE